MTAVAAAGIRILRQRPLAGCSKTDMRVDDSKHTAAGLWIESAAPCAGALSAFAAQTRQTETRPYGRHTQTNTRAVTGKTMCEWLEAWQSAGGFQGQLAAHCSLTASLALLLLLQGCCKVLRECHWVNLPHHRVAPACKDLVEGSKSRFKLHAGRHGCRCCCHCLVEWQRCCCC